MIQEIHGLYDELKDDLKLYHIKAHAGIEGNELADRMTMVAVDEKEEPFSQYRGDMDVAALLRLRAG